ncbi:MAG: type II CAAX prenyl endopeptidase Rce1 family protein [Candidatus Hermodarchaeota archaeon]
MKKKIKYSIIIIIFVLLTIPIYFNVFIDFFFINEFNLPISLILLIGFLTLFLIGKVIEVYGYNAEIIKVMEKHDIINSFVGSNNRIIRLLGFLVIMIIEELIFRYYLIGLLVIHSYLGEMLVILISSLIFSIFHIHTWFSYRNFRILVIFLIYSFFLGLYNGYLLLTLGIIPCILVHYSLAYILYYGIYIRYFKIKT